VLGQDGKIRYKSTGYGDREKALQSILGVVKGEVKAKMKMEREMDGVEGKMEGIGEGKPPHLK